MGKLEDMALLVAVAEAGGLSAAGRRLSLSPATMTARLKAMEERYQTRLFHRFHARDHPDQGGGRFLSCRAARTGGGPSRRIVADAKGRGAERQYSSFRPLRLWPTVS